jgi:hypothetical protein
MVETRLLGWTTTCLAYPGSSPASMMRYLMALWLWWDMCPAYTMMICWVVLFPGLSFLLLLLLLVILLLLVSRVFRSEFIINKMLSFFFFVFKTLLLHTTKYSNNQGLIAL